MDEFSALYVRLNERVHGPLSREDLRLLFSGGHLTPQTPTALDIGGPWTPLAAFPLGKQISATGPRAFERDNEIGGARIDLADIIAAANTPRLQSATPPASPQTESAPHDVRSLLQFNLAIEQARGLHQVQPVPERRSRRRRDYWQLLSVIGVLIFTVLVAESFIAVQLQVLAAQMPDQLWPMFRQVLFHSPILGWGLAAFFFYAIALGWVMFFVMDDY